jgi:hypothetical protein
MGPRVRKGDAGGSFLSRPLALASDMDLRTGAPALTRSLFLLPSASPRLCEIILPLPLRAWRLCESFPSFARTLSRTGARSDTVPALSSLCVLRVSCEISLPLPSRAWRTLREFLPLPCENLLTLKTTARPSSALRGQWADESSARIYSPGELPNSGHS